MKTLKFFLVSAILVFISACQPSQQEQSSTPEEPTIEGTITIATAHALYPLALQWTQNFQSSHPGIRFEIIRTGTGESLQQLEEGKCDMAMISRELTSQEETYNFCKAPVARHGIVAIVSDQNPYLDRIVGGCMNQDLLSLVFTDASKQAWSVIPGITGDKPIHVYVRSDQSGSADHWAKFLWTEKENMIGTGVAGDSAMVASVKNDPLGIGFCSIVYSYDVATRKEIPGIKVVPLDHNFNGKLESNEMFYDSLDLMQRAMWTGKYPCHLYADLYVVMREKPKDPKLKGFMKWVFSDGQLMVSKSGYIKLHQSEVGCRLKELGEN